MTDFFLKNPRNTRARCCQLPFLILLFFFGALSGQGKAQSLTGVVTDVAGVPLPHAAVVLSQNGVIKGGANADESGHYSIPSLPAGSYEVKVNFGGRSYSLPKAELRGETVYLKLELAYKMKSLMILDELQVEVTGDENGRKRKRRH